MRGNGVAWNDKGKDCEWSGEWFDKDPLKVKARLEAPKMRDMVCEPLAVFGKVVKMTACDSLYKRDEVTGKEVKWATDFYKWTGGKSWERVRREVEDNGSDNG